MKLENHFQTLSLIDDTIAYLKNHNNTRILVSQLVKYRYRFDTYNELVNFVKNKHPESAHIWDGMNISYEN